MRSTSDGVLSFFREDPGFCIGQGQGSFTVDPMLSAVTLKAGIASSWLERANGIAIELPFGEFKIVSSAGSSTTRSP